MRSALIDTNVLIPFLDGSRDFSDLFSGFDELVLTSVVIGEFRAGISASKRGRESTAALAKCLANPLVRVVAVTENTAAYYARVFQALKAQGTPIPPNDIWIAASALEHGMELVSSDAHFGNVPMLRLIQA